MSPKKILPPAPVVSSFFGPSPKMSLGQRVRPSNQATKSDISYLCRALLLLLRWLLSNSSSSSWVKKQVEKKDGLRSSKARNVMRGYREMGCNHQIGDSECEHHHTYLEFLLAVSYNWLQYQTPFFRPDCIFHHSDQKVYFRTKNQYSNFHPICHENSNV